MAAQLFSVVELDDPQVIRGRAETIAISFTQAEQAMGHTAQCWSPIGSQYAAPETPQVVAAMDRPKARAGELSTSGVSVRLALTTYSDRLEELEARRRTLLQDIESFTAEDPSATDDRGEREDKISELQQRCHDLARDKDEAQNTCADALGALTTSVSMLRGTEVQVSRANEADGVSDPSPSFGARAAEGLGLRPGKTFGESVDNALWGIHTSLSSVGASSTLAGIALSQQRPRAGWLPKPLQNLAGANSRAASVIARTTGWDVNAVQNGGHFLKKSDPMNPFRNPAGVKDSLQAGLARTLSNLKGDNRTPSPGKAVAYKHWATAGKLAGRVATPLSAVTGFASSWRDDSSKHSEMGNVEKGARATAKTVTTVAGGFAGAKAGAAVGAAIGSLVPIPGVGTAVGAIAGGVIGGAIGSGVGGAIGDGAKSMISKIANGARSIFGN